MGCSVTVGAFDGVVVGVAVVMLDGAHAQGMCASSYNRIER